VGVLSSSSRRYLEILGKLDQLMPLLQTLEIHEVITQQAVDIERARSSARCATSRTVPAIWRPDCGAR
jgi:hypothetical protein